MDLLRLEEYDTTIESTWKIVLLLLTPNRGAWVSISLYWQLLRGSEIACYEHSRSKYLPNQVIWSGPLFSESLFQDRQTATKFSSSHAYNMHPDEVFPGRSAFLFWTRSGVCVRCNHGQSNPFPEAIVHKRPAHPVARSGVIAPMHPLCQSLGRDPYAVPQMRQCDFGTTCSLMCQIKIAKRTI